MNTLFDSAGLAIVAYAEVAADGTSTVNNSGVTTTKTASGTYNVILPADKTQQLGRDLIFVQPNGTGPQTATVSEADAAKKVVERYAGATIADGAFTILILRTIVPPPAGAPA
jgi:hypothetical protein